VWFALPFRYRLLDQRALRRRSAAARSGDRQDELGRSPSFRELTDAGVAVHSTTVIDIPQADESSSWY
jgi:hypothetical protein